MYSKLKTRPLSVVPAFFVCMLFALLVGQTKASAQTCIGSSCLGVGIYNCTNVTFTVTFNVCCNGIVKQTEAIVVPPGGSCATPSTSINFSPCTIINVASIFPNPGLLGIEAEYYDLGCIMKIDYE